MLFRSDEGTKDVAVPSCPPPAPAYQRDLARLPLISAPPAPAPPSTARLWRPRWLLSDAYSASSRGCSGLLAGRGGVGCRLFLGVVLLAADEALRGARRWLHCSERLQRTAAGAMEVPGEVENVMLRKISAAATFPRREICFYFDLTCNFLPF